MMEQNRNIAMLLAYDGTDFHGWQSQTNARTVQDTVNAAVSKITGETVSVIGCGRTDSGVHARVYLATCRVASTLDCDKLERSISSQLPDDISLKAVLDAPWDFHPVRDCIEKEYTYTLFLGKSMDPFLRRYAYHFPRKFDEFAAAEAAKQFLGTHDFNAMRSVGTELKSAVRTVLVSNYRRDGDIVTLTYRADGFLYNMARAMTGTVLDCAVGRIRPDDIAEILRSCDRSRAGATAPAH